MDSHCMSTSFSSSSSSNKQTQPRNNQCTRKFLIGCNHFVGERALTMHKERQPYSRHCCVYFYCLILTTVSCYDAPPCTYKSRRNTFHITHCSYQASHPFPHLCLRSCHTECEIHLIFAAKHVIGFAVQTDGMQERLSRAAKDSVRATRIEAKKTCLTLTHVYETSLICHFVFFFTTPNTLLWASCIVLTLHRKKKNIAMDS